MDRSVECGENVSVEALTVVDRRPTYLVGSHAGARRPALGRSVTVPVDAGMGHGPAGGGRQRVGPMAIGVPGRVEGGVQRANGGLVAPVEVPGADELPARNWNRWMA